MQTVFIGVDVAKAELVISIGDQAPSTVKNETTAINNWLASRPQGACLAMESTGRYHQQLVHLAQHTGFTACVLNGMPETCTSTPKPLALGSRVMHSIAW